jgi:hypothetical protein
MHFVLMFFSGKTQTKKKSGHIMPGTAEQPIFYCGKDSTNCFDTNKMHAGKHHVYQNFSCFVGM